MFTSVNSSVALSVASPTNNSSSDGSNYPTLTAVTITTAFYGTGTGSYTPRPTYSKPSKSSSNGTCGCTVNVRGAEIGYWYSLDQYWNIVTFESTTTDGQLTWTYTPATTTFDLVDQVGRAFVTYVETSVWDLSSNQSTLTQVESTQPLPTAATTTVMSRSDYLPIPTGPLTQSGLVGSLWIDLPPASVAFTGPSSTVFVAQSGTPYVAYSSYEVENSEPVIDANGKISCRSSVTTYDLSDPYAFEYAGDQLGTSTDATGAIPQDFLETIPYSTCVAGTYQGPVTIIYIVHIWYAERWTPFIGHVESSVEQVEVPTLIELSTSRPNAHVETSAENNPPVVAPTSRQGILKLHISPFNHLLA